jgi:two-component system sensor histidine kinase RegB
MAFIPAQVGAGGELFGQLCVDLMALAVLLYLSGGAANPLISLLLIPVAVAALSLPGRLTAAVTVLAVAIYSLLTWFYLPLSVGDAERAARLHLAGMWLTFVVSAAMIAWFVARMTASIRERDRRLAAAREQALRDERVVALGALAAGAAHELGTPLATIAVLVGELEREPALDADARADLALVREQVALCKGIISGMANAAARRAPSRCRRRMRRRLAARRGGALAGHAAAGQCLRDPRGRAPVRRLGWPSIRRWNRRWPTCSTMRPMPMAARSRRTRLGRATGFDVAIRDRDPATPPRRSAPAAGASRCIGPPVAAPASACCWPSRRWSAAADASTLDNPPDGGALARVELPDCSHGEPSGTMSESYPAHRGRRDLQRHPGTGAASGAAMS